MADNALRSLLLGSRALELKNWAKYLRDPTSQVANWELVFDSSGSAFDHASEGPGFKSNWLANTGHVSGVL